MRSGSKGEEVFAKLLSWDGVLDRCVSFWSVWNPEEDGNRNSYGTDIDCILKFGNHIIMVDVKNYRAGLDYHTLIPGHAMFCVYPVARVVAQQPYVFSCNMGFAQRNLSQYLPGIELGCTVESYVVLVPGKVGEAELDADICWPGGIRAMSYSSFVAMIQQRFRDDPSYAVLDRTPVEGYLASLVKLYENQQVLLGGRCADQSAWPRPTCDKEAGIEYPNPKRKQSKPRSEGSARRSSTNRGGASRAEAPAVAKPSTRRDRAPQTSHTAEKKSSEKRTTAKAKPSSRWNPYAIDEVSSVDPTTMSITLGTDENGKDAAISFERVSCMPIGGAVRSGEVSRTFALIAALDQSEDVNLRIIDCKRSSQFSCFQDHAYAYVKMTDGLDLVVDEVQETYTALNARLRKFRKNGASGYWDSPDHAGMPLEVVFVHGCEDLFDRDEAAMDDADLAQLSDIRRYLRKIIENGVEGGCCVVLSSQKPSKKAFPADLIEHAQTRILFKIVVQGQSYALMHGIPRKIAASVTGKAMDIDKIGYAYVVSGGRISPKIMFKALDERLIDERYST